MILPIIRYGNPVLRRLSASIEQPSEELDRLIENMWETLYYAKGCGLAACQVNQPLNLFLVDSATTFERMDNNERDVFFNGEPGIRETFINAQIIFRSKETWTDEEGCLSIPGLYQPVKRPWSIRVAYTDRQFVPQTREFSGLTARMIQHEYDHTQGVLYLDHLKPLTKKLLEKKLTRIRKKG